MFESRDIDVSKLDFADLDQASGFGRSFARQRRRYCRREGGSGRAGQQV